MIKCCNGCVAPKRFVGCHSVCEDYIREKAVHDKELAERNKQIAVSIGLHQQRSIAIGRVIKNRRK